MYDMFYHHFMYILYVNNMMYWYSTMADYTMFRIIILCLGKLQFKYFNYFCRKNLSDTKVLIFYNERNYEDAYMWMKNVNRFGD